MKDNNNIKAFFALLSAGLWGKEVQLAQYGEIDFAAIQKIAEEQSVVGLVAAGMEYIVDMKPAKKDVLQFIGQTLQLEERNKAMNYFIGVLVDKMRAGGIYMLLVKGQGIAQCYEKPLWRSCGDVDFFLTADNYAKAQKYLIPLASSVENEEKPRMHQAMTIDPWVVELHGTMHNKFSNRINKVLDEVQQDIFMNGGVRAWNNDGVDVFLPNPNNDVIIIFTHFIGHFYVGGIGLRQICDWCRLLWTFREQIDVSLLEKRLKAMGLIEEWKAFAAFVVEYLGMPVGAIPLFGENHNHKRLRRKADKICRLIIETGNFGHNKDESYRTKYPTIVEKSITFFRRFGEFVHLSTIFPGNAPRFFFNYVFNRTKATL